MINLSSKIIFSNFNIEIIEEETNKTNYCLVNIKEVF